MRRVICTGSCSWAGLMSTSSSSSLLAMVLVSSLCGSIDGVVGCGALAGFGGGPGEGPKVPLIDGLRPRPLGLPGGTGVRGRIWVPRPLACGVAMVAGGGAMLPLGVVISCGLFIEGEGEWWTLCLVWKGSPSSCPY